MPPTPMTTSTVERAFQRLGARVDYPADIEQAARAVATEMGLPEHWLNSDVQLRIDALHSDWRQRRVLVDAFGRLRVFAASRPDLIAMKILAGRPQDLEDLQSMKLRSDDVIFVRGYLATLAAKGTPQDQIDDALLLLDALPVHPL